MASMSSIDSDDHAQPLAREQASEARERSIDDKALVNCRPRNTLRFMRATHYGRKLTSCAPHKFPASIRYMNIRTSYFWYYYFSMPLAEKG